MHYAWSTITVFLVWLDWGGVHWVDWYRGKAASGVVCRDGVWLIGTVSMDRESRSHSSNIVSLTKHLVQLPLFSVQTHNTWCIMQTELVTSIIVRITSEQHKENKSVANVPCILEENCRWSNRRSPDNGVAGMLAHKFWSCSSCCYCCCLMREHVIEHRPRADEARLGDWLASKVWCSLTSNG